MTEQSSSPQHPTRHKLGLALAGGGFRASLFHVGVLRRLAELDLLRYVEVLSTVSGGSVVGALYLMHLKAELEQPMLAQLPPRQAGLNHGQYKDVVLRVEQDMRRAAQRNLRTRLLMNPLKLASVLLGPSSLATAMAKIYERELLAEAVKLVRATGHQDLPVSGKRIYGWLRQRWYQLRDAVLRALGRKPRAWDGGISIRAMRLRKQAARDAGGSENYNHQALWASSPWLAPGSALTRWIINATSLNSGARFWFSHAELGEWYFGHLRYEEIETELLPRKRLLYPDDKALASPELGRKLSDQDSDWSLAVLACAARGTDDALGPLLPELYSSLQKNGQATSSQVLKLVQSLADAEAGRLRLLKTAAWFLSHGLQLQRPVNDGLSREQHLERFWEAFVGLDATQGERVRAALSVSAPGQSPSSSQKQALVELCRLILEIYNLRAAWMVSPHARQEWQRLPLSQAVTASAAFPPVFPPYLLSDLYDDRRVRTLGLTDGGVFDNMGTMALLDEQCNLIIASDPGGIFETEQQEVSVGRLGLSARLTAILSELPLNLFRHELRERVRLTERLSGQNPGSAAKEFLSLRALKVLICFRIDSGVPLLRGRQMVEERASGEALSDSAQTMPEADQRERRLLAKLRTDLDAFSDLEAEALIRQGYMQAEENLAPLDQEGSPLEEHLKSQRDAAAPYLPPYAPPFHDAAAMRRRERLLRAGRHRFLRLLASGGEGWRSAFLGLALLALLFGLSRDGVSQWVAHAGLPWVQEVWLLAKPSTLRWYTEHVGAWLPWALLALIFGPRALLRRRSADRARRREFGLPPPPPWPLQAMWRSHMPTVLRYLRYYRNTWLYLGMLFMLPMNWVLWAIGLTVALIFAVSGLAFMADLCFSKPLLLLARRGTGVQGIPDRYP